MMAYSIDSFIFHYITALSLTAITSLSLGIFILARNIPSTVNRTFGAFMVAVALWSSTQAMIGTWPNSADWLLIGRLEHVVHVFIPSLLLHFVHAVGEIQNSARLKLSYAISLVCLSLVPTTLFIERIDVSSVAKFALDGGPTYFAYTTWFVATVLEALIKLRRAIVAAVIDPDRQRRLRYVFWGICIGFASGLPNFLYMFDVDVYPINPFSTYLVPVFPAVIAYAIVRHQALDIRIVLKKSLVYSLLVAFITSMYFSIVLLTERLLQDIIGYRSVIGSVIGGFGIALGFNPLKEVLQQFIDRYFFRGTQPALAAENQRLRSELANSERLRAVATLAAGMAHEIKNPLASIKTFAEYLPEKYDDPTFREKFSRIIGQEVEKMNMLLHRLLDFARPRPPERQPARLSTLLDETLELLEDSFVSRRIEIVRSYPPEDVLLVDPAQMRQVFLNLLLNSLEAIEQPGSISIRIGAMDGYLEVIIQDTGRGIRKKDLSRVFDPFYTTKPTGSGLGLPVVHSIIREHGGQLTLESAEGHGTTVRMRLPIHTPSEPAVLHAGHEPLSSQEPLLTHPA